MAAGAVIAGAHFTETFPTVDVPVLCESREEA